MYELADRGETKSAIAKALEQKGLRRRNDKSWTHRQVSAVLGRRRFYETGVVQYGDATGKNLLFIVLPGGSAQPSAETADKPS